jgi:hypothetical protein
MVMMEGAARDEVRDRPRAGMQRERAEQRTRTHTIGRVMSREIDHRQAQERVRDRQVKSRGERRSGGGVVVVREAAGRERSGEMTHGGPVEARPNTGSVSGRTGSSWHKKEGGGKKS